MEYPETLTITVTEEHWMRGREAEEGGEKSSQSCALAQALKESEIGPGNSSSDTWARWRESIFIFTMEDQ